jgi:hypothetical protein
LSEDGLVERVRQRSRSGFALSSLSVSRHSRCTTCNNARIDNTA